MGRLFSEYVDQEFGLSLDFYCHEGKDKNTIKSRFESTEMPWLVPACSPEALKNKISETQDGSAMDTKHLFSEMHIAGLVPGSSNSRLDATAYRWAPGAPLEWAFEFRCRSGSYSMSTA